MKPAVKIGTILFLVVCAVLLLLPIASAASVVNAAPVGMVVTSVASEEASLSEEDTQKALDIIHEAGNEGLTESDREKLLALGLTEDQIQMLQGLSEETENQTGFTDSWVEKEIKWYDKPIVLLAALGLIIAAVLILLFWISRILLFHSGHQRKNKKA